MAESSKRRVVIQADAHLEVARRMVVAAFDAAGYPHEFVMAPLANEKRQLLMLEAGQTDIDLMPVTGERLASVAAGRSRAIAVDLDRGLLGYRHCLLLGARQDMLAGVRSASDLRAFTVGQGEGWMDIEVFKQAGIPIKWVRDWRGGEFIDQMKAGFIDVFPLGAEETVSYFLPHYRARHPDISADPHIVIRYPWFRFVWVSASPNADAIYDALARGFALIARDGRFLEIWEDAGRGLPPEFFHDRRVIELPNPLYGYDIVAEEYRHLLLTPPPTVP